MSKVAAPAKINLRLKITGRRPDGYHLLDMVMVRLDLSDEINFEIINSGISIEIPPSPPLSKGGTGGFLIPNDQQNTLWKVAEMVQQESGRNFGLKIFLNKKIPIAAGLGGGSSDAASLLLALNRELGLDWSREQLIEIGLQIGADLPFFLAEGSQRVTGIGEKLEPIQVGPLPLILVNPGFPVSTKEAYRWWDVAYPLPSVGEGGPPEADRVRGGGLTVHKTGGTPLTLENDLEKVVFSHYPVLAEMKDLLREAGALGALMSGSGGTVFGLFESAALRDQGFDLIVSKKDPNWWLWKGASL